MIQLGDPHEHFWLTRSVAKTVGISLSDEMATGALQPDQFAQMVTRCRACPHKAQCYEWLGQNCAPCAEIPDICANAQTLRTLRNN